MDRISLFIRNLGILLEYLPHRYWEEFKQFIFKKRKLKAPTSPKYLMYLSGLGSIVMFVGGNRLLGFIFLFLYLVFYLYKIWISGDPKVWYRDKYHL